MNKALPGYAGITRLSVKVLGVVQGVGFRPFVYRLATSLGLNGWVKNTSGNVTIQVEGPNRAALDFIDLLQSQAPPVSSIQHISYEQIALVGEKGFAIIESQPVPGQYQPISGDIATCPECLNEIFEPGNRRYLYAFTNCTNCGPRFTIIKGIPYDRSLTTMHRFKMCPACQAEYDDPSNRRFHAQPNACPLCGPQLEMTDNRGTHLDCSNILQHAAGLLQQGSIIAIKGIGGFQLCCDATSNEAVSLLRQRKQRPAKPFAIMMASVDEVNRHCRVSPHEQTLLLSPQAPIVLLSWDKSQSNITETVAHNNNYLGVMLPYSPLHHILMRYSGRPLVMTSGNLSEEPICRDNTEALQILATIADYFILHNRDIHSRYDDSVYYVTGSTPHPIRRARGFAPSPVTLPFTPAGQILSVGAEENNTFCLTRDGYAFVSQHIGDMENEETLEHFDQTISLYRGLFHAQPQVIACDMHPDYDSTRYAHQKASQFGLPVVAIQHHHAHIASCMADNNLTEKVIGVAFDGTGYGSDGNLWGGEFLVCDYAGFERKAHLEYVPMPGGAAAITKPYRMALGYLYTLLGDDFHPRELSFTQHIPAQEMDAIRLQLARQLNTPLTSSAGRLFDAVSAICGISHQIQYRAQAAIELEMAAPVNINAFKPYPFTISAKNDTMVIQLASLFRAILKDLANHVDIATVSGRFHQTVAGIIADTCYQISRGTGIKSVALSGGVFQNRLLCSLVEGLIEKQGLTVFIHHQVPCNDGGISLGQAAAAGKIYQERIK